MYSLLFRACIALSCCVLAAAQVQSASAPSGAIAGIVVERSEGDHATVQIPFLPSDELKRLVDSADSDDSPVF